MFSFRKSGDDLPELVERQDLAKERPTNSRLGL